METCAAPEDATRWARGRTLYVGSSCRGSEPCFPTLQSAIEAARSGDTILLLPGVHSGASFEQNGRLSNLRITSTDREATTVRGNGIEIFGRDAPTGEIWVDNITFANSEPATKLDSGGWGIAVDSWNSVRVRIQDNVFVRHSGGGGIGLLTSTVRTRFHAVIARNTFLDNSAAGAALTIDVPADAKEDYCFRIENNVFARNRGAIQISYSPGEHTPGVFEVVNNTIASNKVGFKLSSSSDRLRFVNNIVFDNDVGFQDHSEFPPMYVKNNLIGSGQFSGLHGNFAADPLFVDPVGGDFHLLPGSPALARAELTIAPLVDVEGTPRDQGVDLGAYERREAPGETSVGPVCGDAVIQRGAVSVGDGTFQGFETCDDGNRVAGDGCSEFCQNEPSGPLRLISMQDQDLCVVRLDGSLSCWNDIHTYAPSDRAYRQVAVSRDHACALRTDGAVTCWGRSSPGTVFVPAGVFTEIAADAVQTCGVHDTGDVECWDEYESTLARPGDFVHVFAASNVCASNAAAELTCWPNVLLPDGPFVQVHPGDSGGCGLKQSGELVCLNSRQGLFPRAPGAGLLRFHGARIGGCGIRPDGRVVQWRQDVATSPAGDREFVECVTDGYSGCALTPKHEVYCWSNFQGSTLPQE